MNKLTKKEYIKLIAENILKEDADFEKALRSARRVLKSMTQYLYFREDNATNNKEYNEWLKQNRKKPVNIYESSHINAEPHKKLMAKLRGMTQEELFQTLVNSGVVDKDGNLTKNYIDNNSKVDRLRFNRGKSDAKKGRLPAESWDTYLAGYNSVKK